MERGLRRLWWWWWGGGCVGGLLTSLSQSRSLLQSLRFSLLRSQPLPVSGNTAILNGFPVLRPLPPPCFRAQPCLACVSSISPVFSLRSSNPPLPPPPLYTVHFFPLPLINTQRSPLSTPHVTHIWLADKLWMGPSHITSKISIVFVNG